MTRQSFSLRAFVRALPRIALLVAVLGAPLLAVQKVEAGATSIIEGVHKRSSGAGLVIVVSLQRA
ncbi:hypothetical protein [Aquamicrobium sp. LC103]|uniref:hypothetical protein n=1 Tax=Aquamicrobium sp. LC103 TaxID=1120658 RepID=UPI00063EA379|nr:hypothetical protein [Aquamicrobium sp. LC103]TKT81263.1 hypothetical protein XW59_005190 [Aquamicrobium sp. LC103]